MKTGKRLYKRQEGKIITGVAGGVADFFGIEIPTVRWIWGLGWIFTGTFLFWIYVILSFILKDGTKKEEDQADEIRRLKAKIYQNDRDRSEEINELKKKAEEVSKHHSKKK